MNPAPPAAPVDMEAETAKNATAEEEAKAQAAAAAAAEEAKLAAEEKKKAAQLAAAELGYTDDLGNLVG